jgi:hypothetical protein
MGIPVNFFFALQVQLFSFKKQAMGILQVEAKKT